MKNLFSLLSAIAAITLYYTPNCPYCHEVMDYLHSIHKTVPMTNLDGNDAGQKELQRIGGEVHVPCLVVDGKAYYGSDDAIGWLSKHQSQLSDE